ncbi:carbon starvation CstA family protein [Natronobiforma cellulositropha]|uniref:carbon starvation CstA family protein n=1 Tax=Natronobiforma cellulositropha TaxID=1679076 RepID=UPI0021D59A36|nr:carbon starvation CstA family protein [Natronobiforma cellulositropha]
MEVQVIWFVVFVLATFTVGYIGYSAYLARLVEIDDDRETPAHRHEDGQEYVPSKRPVLLGHHFSSVAGGAPIAGPLTAVAAFGWLPGLLWVAIGNPIFGAVHDFMALSSSVRHEGKSIGYIIGEYVGERGKNMLLWFAFLLVVLVVAAFVFLIAQVFNAYPPAATASVIYIALALAFGVYLYQLNGPFLPGAVFFVAGVFAGVWVGIQFPIALAGVDGLPEGTIVLLGDGANWAWLPLADAVNPNFALWAIVTVCYSFVAAVLPVWVLLQPRDFLTSTLLYTGIGAMLLGVFVGTYLALTGAFTPVDIPVSGIEAFDSVTIEGMEAAIPAYTGFVHPGLGPLLPFLFLTIACGTISGFHSLVSSGTTAKQLDRESDARVIGYGAMLGEGLLALTSIIAVSLAAATVAAGDLGAAIAVFPAGGGALVTTLGVSAALASTFIALVFASFLLTSTDTAMRLGRYLIEELVGTPETSLQETMTNRYANAGVTAVGGYVLVASGSWENLWLLFGGANQMLAALALLVVTVWLANWSSTKQLLSTGVPLAFMMAVTVIGLLWVSLIRFPAYIIEPAAVGPEMTEWEVWSEVLADPGTITNIEASLHTLSFTLLSLIALVLVWLAISLLRMGVDNVREARAGLSVDALAGGEPGDDD